MKRYVVVTIVFLAAALFAQPAPAQQALRPGRLPREVRAALKQGLTATFTSARESVGSADARVARMAALYVSADSPATPFIGPGPFKAVYHGYLKLKLKGDYVFGATGTGRLTLHINGAPALRTTEEDLSRIKPVQVALVKGYNEIRVEYESPARGDSVFRIHWSVPDAYAESVPPTMLFHDSTHPALAQGLLLREGRALVADRQCLKCHSTAGDPFASAGHMPELDRDAPNLIDAGARLTETWMARWILDPRSLRTNVTMPAVLHGLKEGQAAQIAADVAAYLAGSRKANVSSARAVNERLVDDGAALFETLGCVACHLVNPPEEDDLYDRTTLRFVGRKFQPGALEAFLLNPHKNYAWSRMPDFRLTGQEAAALAAYLLATADGQVAPVNPPLAADATRGRAAFGQQGCVNCHDVGENAPEKLTASPLRTSSQAGCLAADTAATAPDFGFSDDQRQSLLAFLSTGGDSLAHTNPAEAAGRTIEQLRCVACHSRDERYNRWPEILLEESSLGLPPEIVPHLTWAGEKLQAPWIERLVNGRLSYRSRPWLVARMPAFPVRASVLARGLAAQHGIGFVAEAPPELVPETVEIGRRLTLKEGGFYCMQCHGQGKTLAEGAFDSRGVNFSYIGGRLRHEYYLRWMANPLQYDPATKMPKFSPDGATTPLTHVYDGDATRQFDALWLYLHSLDSGN